MGVESNQEDQRSRSDSELEERCKVPEISRSIHCKSLELTALHSSSVRGSISKKLKEQCPKE